MTVYFENSKGKELYYDGSKIKEAWYNGEKVYSSSNVLFEADITFNSEYTLPATYPAGSIIEWTRTTAGTNYMYDIRDESLQQMQFITLGQVTTTTIAFNKLGITSLWGGVATYTYHIKITKGA